MRRHFPEVLHNKNFFLLYCGQLTSQLGDQINTMALIALIWGSAPGSALELAKLMLGAFIPFVFFSPLFGVIIDHYDQKKILIFSDILRGLLVMAIPLIRMVETSNLSVYVIVFLVFSINRLSASAKSSVISSVVPEKDLLPANTLATSSGKVMEVMGLAVGGFIVKWVGWRGGFYLNSLSYFLSAIIISYLIIEKPFPLLRELGVFTTELLPPAGVAHHRQEVQERMKNSWRRFTIQLKDGLKSIVRYRVILFSISSIGVLFFAIGMIAVSFFILLPQKYGTGVEKAGILSGAAGLGVFLGSIVLGRYGRQFSKKNISLLCFLMLGLGLMMAARVNTLHFLIIISGFLGFFFSPIPISAEVLLQANVPRELRGRVMVSKDSVEKISLLMGVAVTTLLMVLVGGKVIALTVPAVLLLSFTAVAIFAFRHRKSVLQEDWWVTS